MSANLKKKGLRGGCRVGLYFEASNLWGSNDEPGVCTRRQLVCHYVQLSL